MHWWTTQIGCYGRSSTPGTSGTTNPATPGRTSTTAQFTATCRVSSRPVCCRETTATRNPTTARNGGTGPTNYARPSARCATGSKQASISSRRGSPIGGHHSGQAPKPSHHSRDGKRHAGQFFRHCPQPALRVGVVRHPARRHHDRVAALFGESVGAEVLPADHAGVGGGPQGRQRTHVRALE